MTVYVKNKHWFTFRWTLTEISSPWWQVQSIFCFISHGLCVYLAIDNFTLLCVWFLSFYLLLVVAKCSTMESLIAELTQWSKAILFCLLENSNFWTASHLLWDWLRCQNQDRHYASLLGTLLSILFMQAVRIFLLCTNGLLLEWCSAPTILL